MASPWLAYNDLAWTERLLADPDASDAEAAFYADAIKRTAAAPPATLLHLGCGAGGYDRIFKRDFAVTGVDVSNGMLAIARAAHPDIEYIEGDMRTLRLNRQFDAVAIPDSIDYMATLADLERAIETAVRHLKPGGVLLVVAKPAETFRNNNFAYTGSDGDVEITLLENNYINPYRPNIYEATLVYLIRKHGVLTIHTDHHTLGLFPAATWHQAFHNAGLSIEAVPLDGVYDDYLLGGGEYPMTVFIGLASRLA